MFTASRRSRSEQTHHARKATVLILAALVLANVVAIAGFGVAHAGSFPDVRQYAPMTLPRDFPAMTEVGPEKDASAAPARTVTVPPVERSTLVPAVRQTETVRNFTEVVTKSSVIRAAEHAKSRYMLIALMTLALGTMGGVSIHMFRSLAREISDGERSRTTL